MFLALMLQAGKPYLAGVYVLQRYKCGLAALLIILGASFIFCLFFLSLSLRLTEGVYRYQGEGRIAGAGNNPCKAYLAMPGLRRAQNPDQPVETGRATPTPYPPLSEAVFASAETVANGKRFFTALNLVTVALIMSLLAATWQPVQQVPPCAWNPAVLTLLALSGHNGSLANVVLLAAIPFIIGRRNTLSIAFLTF